MKQITNRFLIEEYMMGNGITQELASYFLSESGSWMFEDGAADEYHS